MLPLLTLCERLNWLCLVQEIANDILSEQTPKRLFAVRGKLYELLVNCIPPELILKKLMLELVRKLDDELKHKVADCAAFFEHRLQVMAAIMMLSIMSHRVLTDLCGVLGNPLFDRMRDHSYTTENCRCRWA